MRSTPGQARAGRLGGSTRSGWGNLAWKLFVALAILFLMAGTPLSWAVAWGVLNPIPATLIVWGALVVGIAASNLFEDLGALRWLWVALNLGAYLALTIPGVLTGPDRLIEA